MDVPLDRFDHPTWVTGASTAIGYGIALVFMFVLLFVIPFLIFLAL
jgi:hypothetical protein